MDKLLESCPALSEAEISRRIDEEGFHQEFLFYRRADGDDLDWILGAPEDGYQMFCTACGQEFFQPRDRKHTAKTMGHCPRCGAPVTPCRWRDRKKLEEVQFAWHLFQRGAGPDVWLRSFQVSMRRDFRAGKYDIFEYCRIVFQPGGAHKWTRSRDYMRGVHPWEPVKTIRLKQWHGGYGFTRENAWAGVTIEEMAGSCLQYAPMGEIMQLHQDPVPLLALWAKYPAAEYVYKLLPQAFLWRDEDPAAFRAVVNLRATRPDRLFPHLSRGEVRVLRREMPLMSLYGIALYQRLKKAGAVEPGRAGMAFASEIGRYQDFFELAGRCGTDGRTLRRYLQRQAKRRGVRIGDAMQELEDYLRQLARLGVQGGETMPHDLHAAHERLSARERKIINAPLNGKFRARRHLLRWMRWRHGGLLIRPVDSAEEITREGEQMHNCVAGYASWHAEGKTIILLLRRCSAPGESWHTVEIEPNTFTCRQCYAAHNRPAEPEAQAFMALYLEHLQQLRPQKRKKERSAA